jgi:hypothetical protein
MDEHGVTFRTRGQNTVTVSPDVFLSRFVLHVLPHGFVKIRHYGLLAAGNVNTKLAAARQLLNSGDTPPAAPAPRPPSDFREVLLALTGIDLRRCTRCGGSICRHPLSILDARPALTPPPDTS